MVSSGVLFSESSDNDTIKVDGQCQEQNKHQRKRPSIAKKPVAKKRMKRTVHKIMKKDKWKWEDIEDNYQPRACSFNPRNPPGVGSDALLRGTDPLACLDLFLPSSLVAYIVEQTNLYANQTYNSK